MLAEFIKDLREAGIELRCDGDRLICDAPKGAMTETLVSEIRERKEAIISFLKETIATESAEPSLASVPRASGLPVTPAQERLLFIEQLEPNNTFFNLAGAFRLTSVGRSMRLISLMFCLFLTFYAKGGLI